MRVGLDVTPLLGHRTGVGQVVAGIVDGTRDLDDPPLVTPFVMSRRGGSGVDLPPGTRRLPLPASLLLRAWSLADRPRGDRWLPGLDVVHGTNFVVPPMARSAEVVTVHDCWCARRPDLCPPATRRFTSLVRRAVTRGAWLHVSTDFVAAEVRDLFGAERVAVAPFGVPPLPTAAPAHALAATVPALPEGAPYVLALGSLDRRKNLSRLVEALGEAAGTGSELHLVLAGPDGPARGEVEAAVAALPAGLASRVHLTGPVPDDVRAGLLRGARILAYPSLYEGFGFPVLEAMSEGIPVVATTAGALPEVAGDAAVLVDPLDTAALAAALVRVSDDASLRSELVERGRSRAGRYRWTTAIARLHDLWRTAAESR